MSTRQILRTLENNPADTALTLLRVAATIGADPTWDNPFDTLENLARLLNDETGMHTDLHVDNRDDVAEWQAIADDLGVDYPG